MSGSTDAAVCPPGSPFAAAVEAVRRGDRDAEDAAGDLVGQLTDRELLWLLDGDQTFLEMARRFATADGTLPLLTAGALDRLGIPGIRFTDGPRGVTVGRNTSFPVPIARAATWDPDLERAVGAAMGAEARVRGANHIGAPCINLAYDPGWGRAQESYGEDPVLLGAMGAAFSRGVQPWVLSCVKHYAVNSMEEARFRVDVRVDEDVLREVYLPHFRTVVEAGADAVMSAYNAVNGEWCGQHDQLLTEILRDDWGFAGIVETDWMWGLRDAVASVHAGQDLEMPLRQQRAHDLPAAARAGRLDREAVVRSATRIVATQLRLAARARPTPPADVVASQEHRDLARDVARRGAVLLRNEEVHGTPTLPLDPEALRRLAVLGPLADRANQGDVGSSNAQAPSVVTILDGLRERLGDRVVHVADDVPTAVAAARSADAAVVVVGLSSRDEGESLLGLDADSIALFGGIARFRPVATVLAKVARFSAYRAGWGGDRRDLRLHADDVALIREVAAANPRTIVVVIGGGTIVVDPWDQQVGALLLAWYPGMEGGRAIADVLLGDHEPGGRLPVAIPHRREDLPVLDWDADRVTYGRWWGQRKLDHDGVAAAYPFGFGLGYTTFEIEALELGPVEGETFTAFVTVANSGRRRGRHVIQVYARLPGHEDPPVRALVGFRPVELEPGERSEVTIECSTRPVQHWTGERFVVPSDRLVVEAASYSGDPDALTGEVAGLRSGARSG